MNAYVYIGLSSGLFLLAGTYWKSKSAIVFLFLCAGNILSATVSGTIATKASEVISSQSFPINSIAKGTLLIVPAVVAMLITKGSAKKKHVFLNIALSIITSLLGYLWFIRVLSFEQFSVLETTLVTQKLLTIRDAALGFGVMLSLIYLIFDSKKKSSKHDKSKKD